jgi:hypothetical protein
MQKGSNVSVGILLLLAAAGEGIMALKAKLIIKAQSPIRKTRYRTKWRKRPARLTPNP